MISIASVVSCNEGSALVVLEIRGGWHVVAAKMGARIGEIIRMLITIYSASVVAASASLLPRTVQLDRLGHDPR